MTQQRPMLSPSNGNKATAIQSSPTRSLGKEFPMQRPSGENMSSGGDYFGGQSTQAFHDGSKIAHKSTSPEERGHHAVANHPWHNLFGNNGPLTSTHMPMHTPLPQASVDGKKPEPGHAATSSSSSRGLPAIISRSLMNRVHSAGSAGSSRSSSSILPPEELSKYRALEASKLAETLLDKQSMQVDGLASKERVLILDIRPSTSYATARIHGSINICAPSTLLKRTGVTVQRVEEEMLANVKDQERFSGWRKGPRKSNDSAQDKAVDERIQPIETIVVLDTDTRNILDAGKPAAGGGGSCLTGLLKKFDQAGYGGSLWWLVGGFEEFSKLAGPDEQVLVDRTPLASANSGSASSRSNGAGNVNEAHVSSDRRSSVPNLGALGQNGEKRLAGLSGMRTNSLVQPKGLPMEAFMSSSTARGKSASMSQALSGQVEAQQEPDTTTASLNAANPFFDNIRQNRELQNGVTERIPLTVPEMTEGEARRLPEFLGKIRQMESQERASTLAQSFYEVEQAERDRLMDTMQRHADESDCKRSGKSLGEGKAPSLNLSSQYSAVSPGEDGHVATKATFPFSIAAALERGGENRYNNIWTYEHSRVRCPQSADYLNGSYIEPARQFGCKRRYIATQAPLPSTFDTFWSVIWQQNVHTICMVTREFESGRVQSHNYWLPKRYGTLELSVVEEVRLDGQGNVVEKVEQEAKKEENYFALSRTATEEEEAESTIIRRTLRLCDDIGNARTVTQFQFIAWPDYSVPDRPEDLLVLMRLASAAQHSVDVELRTSGSPDVTVGPLVVHCSAGVGRTGTYVVVDSALDVIRRMRWAQTGRSARDTWDTGYNASTTSVQERRSISRLADSAWNSRTSTPQQRKNLKRELSPSGMDLDVRASSRSGSSPTRDFDSDTNESGRDIGSPPPTRRSRPDSDADSLSLRSSSPTSMLGSSATTNPLSFGAISVDGPQTPSTALREMSLSSGTPGRPRINSNVIPHQGLNALNGKGSSGGSSNRSEPSTSTPDPDNKPQGPHTLEGVDLIRNIVDTVREQRMSMVQTTRQYVFAYWAVFCGTLDEMRREDTST